MAGAGTSITPAAAAGIRQECRKARVTVIAQPAESPAQGGVSDSSQAMVLPMKLFSHGKGREPCGQACTCPVSSGLLESFTLQPGGNWKTVQTGLFAPVREGKWRTHRKNLFYTLPWLLGFSGGRVPAVGPGKPYQGYLCSYLCQCGHPLACLSQNSLKSEFNI